MLILPFYHLTIFKNWSKVKVHPHFTKKNVPETNYPVTL